MNRYSEMLSKILSSELLAPKITTLAKDLGYQTHSSISRVRDGVAGERACLALMDALEENLGVDEDDLRDMQVLLSNYERISWGLKEFNKNTAITPTEVIMGMLGNDFSSFSREWRERELPKLMRFAEESPVNYYRMLFYYYVKRSYTTFYLKGKSFTECCKRVLVPLTDRLSKIYPRGDDYIGILEGTQYDDSHYTTLWECVDMGSRLLMFYGSPEVYKKLFVNIILLPGVDARSYWLTSAPEKILLLLEIKLNAGHNGSYTLFMADINSGELHFFGTLNLYQTGMADIMVGAGIPSYHLYYVYEKGCLRFFSNGSQHSELKKKIGMDWQLLDIRNNVELTGFDEALTDDEVADKMLKGYGWTLLEEVDDVIISRSDIQLKLASGGSLMLSRDAYDFLKHINSMDSVTVMRCEKDGCEYVRWDDLNFRIPLEEFKYMTP